MVLEKSLESLLDRKEIKPVNPKGNQLWIFIGRTDAVTPILWPPDAKSQLIRKGPDAGKDWRQEEKGMTEDEIVGWHRRLNGHEFEPSLGVCDDSQASYPLLPPFPFAFNVSQHQGLFQWVNSLHQVAKVLEFQLQHQSFQWTPRTDLLAIQGTLKSLLQHHSSKASVLQLSAFFMVQL